MRDYVGYFNERKTSEKRGVSVHRDIDWWVGYVARHLAKGLFLIIFALVFFVVWLIWQTGQNQQVFPITQIKINGEIVITQPEEMTPITDSVREKSFFFVDITQLKEQITALPWVASVTIKRQWPDTLLLEMVERKAAYRWGDAALVDADGNRFSRPVKGFFDDLPLLVGLDGSEHQLILAYQQLMHALGESAWQLPVKSLKLNQYLSWELHLSDGLVVKFGRDDYTRRMRRFVQAYRAGRLPTFAHLEVLDFRYFSGFAVRWKADHMPKSASDAMVKVNETKI